MRYRLVDYLTDLLTAQAEILQRLDALVGEERLLDALEHSPETTGRTLDDPTRARALIEGAAPPPEKTAAGGAERTGSTYSLLSATVRDLGLPEWLEFHVWAYPHYRSWIEGAFRLDAEIRLPEAGETQAPLHRLIDETVHAGHEWARKLPLSPTLGRAVESASENAWLRFRTRILRKIGLRPLAALSAVQGGGTSE